MPTETNPDAAPHPSFRRLSAEEEQAIARTRPGSRPPAGLRPGEPGWREWLEAEEGRPWDAWLRSEGRRALIESCYPLACRLVLGRPRGRLRDDAQGLAHLALCKAADNFDPAQGCRFTTFSTSVVMATIARDGPRLLAAIHVPEHLRFCMRADDGGRTVALHGRLGWRALAADARRAMAIASLDVLGLDGGSFDPRDARPSPQDEAADAEARARDALRLERALAGLGGREALAVRLYHLPGPDGETLTFEEIGERLGVTRENARQIVAKGRRWLREILEPGEGEGRRAAAS